MPARAGETLAEAKDISARANTLKQKRQFDKAEALYQRSLRIRERVLGASHTKVGIALYEMAPVYFRKNKFGEAERILKRALTIFEKNLGSDHSRIANTLSRLAFVYATNGKDASLIQKRAASMRKRLAGVSFRQLKGQAKAPAGRKRMAKAPVGQLETRAGEPVRRKGKVDRRSRMERLAGAPIGLERLADGRTLREWFEGQ